jgi:hypothetical protein
MNPSIIIIIILTIILVFIYILSPSSSLPDKPFVYLPTSSVSKVTCANTKQSCQSNDDCNNTCNDVEQMSCVSTSTYGNVCLPKEPDTYCNTEKGGLNIWTGYGFTDQSAWSCMCQYPEYFIGEHCDKPNPYFCTGGTIDNSKGLYDTSCSCPDGTTKMYRAQTNVPFCAISTPSPSLEYGLTGNISKRPSWENIYINNGSQWANHIYSEMYNKSDTTGLINKIQTIIGTSPTLTTTIVSNLCKMTPSPDNLCINNTSVGFSPENFDTVTYTYYDNSYF